MLSAYSSGLFPKPESSEHLGVCHDAMPRDVNRNDRKCGRDLVEIFACWVLMFSKERIVVALADHPLAGALLVCLGLQSSDKLPDVVNVSQWGAGYVDHDLVKTRAGKVSVRIDKPRQQRVSVQIVALGFWRLVSQLHLASDRKDSAAFQKQCLNHSIVIVHGQNRATTVQDLLLRPDRPQQAAQSEQ